MRTRVSFGNWQETAILTLVSYSYSPQEVETSCFVASCYVLPRYGTRIMVNISILGC